MVASSLVAREGTAVAAPPALAPQAPGSQESLREVPLQVLCQRASPSCVVHRCLLQGLDGPRRLDALEWLVQAFDAMNLPDPQLVSAFSLLDRYAAAAPQAISAGPGAFALVLAAMIVALKVSGTQRDLERAKKLVVEVSGSSRPWTSVRKAELSILRRLDFHTGAPTARDLLDRLVSDAAPTPGAADWDPERHARCGDLARFLLELAMVHEAEVLYGSGRPPLVGAVAALWLAFRASGAPLSCERALREAVALLPGDGGAASVAEVAEAMRTRWAAEEEKSATGSGACATSEKWTRRLGGLPASLAGSLGEPESLVLASAAPAQAPPAARAGGCGSPRGGRVAHFLAAIPTPMRRTAAGPAAAGAGTGAAGASGGAAEAAGADAEGAPAEEQQRGGSKGAGSKHRAAQHPPQLTRASGADKLSSLPVGRGGAPAAEAAHAASTPPAGVPVDMTQAMALAFPRSASSGGAAHAGARPKHGGPSELLGSSALRMAWPSERRQVQGAEAAAACREAAASLHEAAAQLLGAATGLDGGASASGHGAGGDRAAAQPPLDPRRRRTTFAGAGAATARGASPHTARTAAGLRV